MADHNYGKALGDEDGGANGGGELVLGKYTDDEAGLRAWFRDNKLATIADIMIKAGVDTVTSLLDDVGEDDKEDLTKEGVPVMKFKVLLKAIKKAKEVPATGEGGGGAGGGETEGGGGVLGRAASMEGKEGKEGKEGDAAVYLIDPNDLQEGDKLGEGEFGTVAGGIYFVPVANGKKLKVKVAIKKVNPEHLRDARALADIVAENDRLAVCDSPFVTKCYGTTAPDPDQGLSIVMELCNLGDLRGYTNNGSYDILGGSRMCPLPHAEMILITLQMLLGLDYVHGKGMIHRDIAARNIMLKTSDEGAVVAKLADLGMTREVGEGKTYYTISETKNKLPIAWCPPETAKAQKSKSGGEASQKADASADMWALGVTIYEMVTNCSGTGKEGPYLAQGTIHEIKKGQVINQLADISLIRNFIKDKQSGPGGRLHIPEACPAELRVLMQALWSSKKTARPTACQAVVFLVQACAPLLEEAREWTNEEASAAKMNAWLVGDLGIEMPRPMEVFGLFDYDNLVKDAERRNWIAELLGSDFVIGKCYKAISREIRALKMLNDAVEQEPLKSALEAACKKARKKKSYEAKQQALSEALETARAEAAEVRRAAAAEEKEGKGDDGDAFDDASVPLSGFSQEIEARIKAEEAKEDDADFELLGQLSETELPAARALDVAAHKEHLACVARKAELDEQFAAAKKAKDFSLCGSLQKKVKEAKGALEAATDRRAKEWAQRLKAEEKVARQKAAAAKYGADALWKIASKLPEDEGKYDDEEAAADLAMVEELIAAGINVRYEVRFSYTYLTLPHGCLDRFWCNRI